MQITILTQYYAPEIGAPQRRLGHLAETFVRRGHRVTVLTAMPSYPRGKVYPGYGGARRVEEQDGIRLVRTFVYPTQSPRFLPRLANYFSFVGSSALLGGWSVPQSDYVLTESPPLFLGLAGFLISRWKRSRWIFNVSDIWPESAVRVGILGSGLFLSSALALEAFCYRRAWLVTGQSNSIVENIRSRFPTIRTRLVSNGVDTNEFRPSGSTSPDYADLHPRGRVAAVYAGLHGLAQGLDQVVSAASLLGDESKVEIFMAGDGPTRAALVEQGQKASLKNIHFMKALPAERMPGWLGAGDIAIVPLKMYIPGAVPSKLYEAMATGLPVVLVTSGEAAEIVRRHQAGLVVEPGDVGGLAFALERLASDPALRAELGANGRRAAEQLFDRRVINTHFIEYLEQQS